MPSEGPLTPATIASADDPDYGSTERAWDVTTNSVQTSDDVRNTPTGNLSSTIPRSELLKATNFGFAIPAGATIDGIVVAIERSKNLGSIVDGRVSLIKGGTVQSTDKADTVTDYGTTDATASYGSSTDLWGSAWTDSDINSSSFGLAFSGAYNGSGGRPRVDLIQITVHYTAGGNQNVSVTGLASASAFGSPTIVPGGVSVTMTGLASAQAFGTITPAPGGVTVEVTGLGSASAFGTPEADQTIHPTGLGSASAFGTPTIAVGNVNVPVTGLGSASQFGTVTLPGTETFDPAIHGGKHR